MCRVLRTPKPQLRWPSTGIGPILLLQALAPIQLSRSASSATAIHCAIAWRSLGSSCAACGCILPNSSADSSRDRGICCSVASGGALVSGCAWQLAQCVSNSACGSLAAIPGAAQSSRAPSAGTRRARLTNTCMTGSCPRNPALIVAAPGAGGKHTADPDDRAVIPDPGPIDYASVLFHPRYRDP